MADRGTERTARPGRNGTIGYVLMGYPRMTELFIASEIWRLEQNGVPLRLFVLKPRDEERYHRVVGEIRTVPEYLPTAAALKARPFHQWVRQNVPRFLPALRREARRHPLRVARCAAWAVALAVEGRKGWKPTKVPAREFLRAVALADMLHDSPEVSHLHAHFAHGTTTVTWWASIISGRSFSFTGHAKDIYERSQNPGGLLARKMRAARFVVTCTGANHDYLESVGVDVPIHLVYHGLNTDFTRLLAQSPPAAPPQRFRVIGVGSLVHKKGFDLLVEAVAILRRRGVALDAVIAGGGGDNAEEIRTMIRERGLTDAVTLLGPVTQEQLLDEYRRSSVFALPCRVTENGDRDGIPNVMVEAMAAGLPAVSTPVSGIPELIEDGVNGVLVAPESPEALADGLQRLAGDPALCERLARAGRATVQERFDGDVLALRMAALFRAVGE